MTGVLTEDRPLCGIRVVDGVHGPLSPISRLLAELGARVDRVVAGFGTEHDAIDAIAAHAGKVVHPEPPAAEDLAALIGQAHIVLEDAGQAGFGQGLDPAAFLARHPRLVWMTVSPFGTGNAYSGWQMTDPVLHALSGELARSGLRGRAPLLPPGELAYQCAATQGAYLLLAALYRALRSGRGEHLDFAALDGAMQALDPGFGIGGSATMGRPARALHRGRPTAGIQYPILACADGHARICLLAPRQWRGMFRWMGEPAAFAAPEFDQIATRYKSPDLLPAIGAFFADKTREQLEREGQEHGVPIAGLLSLAEFMDSAHARSRDAITHTTQADGTRVALPNGMIVIDGARMGPIATPETAGAPPGYGDAPIARPFTGLRVLDLGVIVVGAEAGRLLADAGADVIKIESRSFPDGNRQSYLPYDLSVSFAAGHRNKRSLGIDLRSDAGRALFLRLAAEADVILSNFKPGTLDSLGIGYDAVAKVRPGIVMVDSSAFGSHGLWSRRMGYGPLVRASTGMTGNWRYPDDPTSFSDSVTIYPDHAAGRVSAIGAVALLIRRLRTGLGGTASVAQAEVILAHAADSVARISLGQDDLRRRDVPWGVFPAAGDDDFAVITARGQADWNALTHTIDGLDNPQFATPHDRQVHRATIEATIARWCATRTPTAIAETLQAAGIPAAPMLRVADQLDFPYFVARDLFRTERHPHLDEDVVSERRQYLSAHHAEPERQPAPLAGEHSVAVVRDWLGLSEDEIAELVAGKVIEPTPATVYEAIARTRAKAAAVS